MKVGELARRTGISVRTLHYYDEIGLLSPSLHNESGHRLYRVKEVARLQQIRSLRQLGLSLDEIRRLLKSRSCSPQRVVEMHLSRVRDQMALLRKLHARLEGLAERIRSKPVSIDELIQTIEVMNMFEKYYTEEQLEELRQRREKLGEEGMRKGERDWAELMAEVRVEIGKGADPTSERVLALARRWRSLIDAFTGGNPEIERSLGRMYQNEPIHQKIEGTPEPEMMAYMGKAMAALKNR